MLAFLLAAVIPTAIAGAIGIYLSPHTFRTETLGYLQQKVEVPSQAVGRFLDPFHYWSGDVWNRRKDDTPYAEMQTISMVPDVQGNIWQIVTLFSVQARRPAE